MFFGSKTVFLGQEVHYYMVCIAYFTELSLQICNCAHKRRICRQLLPPCPTIRFFNWVPALIVFVSVPCTRRYIAATCPCASHFFHLAVRHCFLILILFYFSAQACTQEWENTFPGSDKPSQTINRKSRQCIRPTKQR